jgi:hypothetical protein
MARDLMSRLDGTQHRTLRRLPKIELVVVGPAVRAARMEPAALRGIAEVRR